MKTIIHVIFTSFITMSLCQSQTLYKSSIDAGGAIVSVGDIQVHYTLGEVNIQELDAGTIAVSEGFINAELRLLIAPQAFLQGPAMSANTAGLMNDDLRTAVYLPTTSPYADQATVAASVFNDAAMAQNNIVDWVWLELRAANDHTKTANSRSALLQRDGDIVDFDGESHVLFRASQTSYYVVVKHRNHLGVMTAAAISLSDTPIAVNFTDAALTTYGTEARVGLASGEMALWAGDGNTNGHVVFSGANNDANTIKDYILGDPANVLNFVTFSSSGYLNEDLDMNGTARFSGAGNDGNIIKDNILSHPSNFLNFQTFTISTSVPPQN
jgi:hypothetical protein